MLLKKLLAPGKKEKAVIEDLTRHIKLLYSGLDAFERAFRDKDRDLMASIIDLEREADVIRRDVISNIYEGAFLPYLRPRLCRFAEVIDCVFDLLEDAAYQYLDLVIDASIQNYCTQIAALNERMCEMLLLSFETLMGGGDLRDKALAIRVYEKKVDDIKLDLVRDLRNVEVKTFWDGKALSDFVSSLTSVSDIIEDASDYLQVINVSMR